MYKFFLMLIVLLIPGVLIGCQTVTHTASGAMTGLQKDMENLSKTSYKVGQAVQDSTVGLGSDDPNAEKGVLARADAWFQEHAW